MQIGCCGCVVTYLVILSLSVNCRGDSTNIKYGIDNTRVTCSGNQGVIRKGIHDS